jgi:hypothetical protein
VQPVAQSNQRHELADERRSTGRPEAAYPFMLVSPAAPTRPDSKRRRPDANVQPFAPKPAGLAEHSLTLSNPPCFGSSSLLPAAQFLVSAGLDPRRCDEDSNRCERRAGRPAPIAVLTPWPSPHSPVPLSLDKRCRRWRDMSIRTRIFSLGPARRRGTTSLFHCAPARHSRGV